MRAITVTLGVADTLRLEDVAEPDAYESRPTDIKTSVLFADPV